MKPTSCGSPSLLTSAPAWVASPSYSLSRYGCWRYQYRFTRTKSFEDQDGAQHWFCKVLKNMCTKWKVKKTIFSTDNNCSSVVQLSVSNQEDMDLTHSSGTPWRIKISVEYLMLYRGPGFLAVAWFGSSPTPSPPFPSDIVVSLSQSSSVSPFELSDGRGRGGRRGWTRSHMIRPRESMAL